ncbi:hypothetical protein A3Q56_00793 [Intoshia linei]|uniref:Uncharacterized protein n=1 Tax=Intoshia linei TaxID=1819745 RepID=A0A177BAU9_9BILA|nr:hypothetical protein A3Q56_00793 [Intoshia linei]
MQADSDMDKKNIRKEAQEIIKISPEKELQIEVLNNEFQEPEPKKQRKSISTTISPKNKIDNELLIPKTHNYEKLKKTLNHFNLSYKDL